MARSNRRDCRTGERKRTADVQRRDQQIRSIRKEHKQQQSAVHGVAYTEPTKWWPEPRSVMHACLVARVARLANPMQPHARGVRVYAC